jgi:DNA repair protein RadD
VTHLDQITMAAPVSGGFTLRPYQQEAVSLTLRYLHTRPGRNGLLVLPTGSGKSLVIAELVKELGKPTLIFQPSKEILQQNLAKYRSYGFPAGIYSASAGYKELRNVTFATVGSVAKKKHLLERFEYVLVDECHFVNARGGQYEDVIAHMGVPVIGLTATPYRLGKVMDEKGLTRSILKFLTRTQPRVFDDVIHYVQNRDLFAAGYLAKLQYFEVQGFNRSLLRTNTTGADYTDASVKAAYAASGFHHKLVKVVNRLFEIGRRNAIVFTRFVEEARFLAQMVPGCAMVSAETPDRERDRIITLFKLGKIRCVANVGILTTGFDYPELEAVVVARATMSLALWYQMVGRGIRPHPDKDHTMVVDMGGNIPVFGRVEDLELSREGGWHVRSRGRQLTNVPFGKAYKIAR